MQKVRGAEDIKRIKIFDTHTGGEPTRLVIDGFPNLREDAILERRALLAQRHGKWRSAAVTEPRGSDVIVGALVSEPVDSANAAGVIFFNKTLATRECAATAPLAW